MVRGWIVIGLLAVLSCCASATGAGRSGVTTRYFDLDVENLEYTPDMRRPTAAERIREVTGYWRFFLQTYRAVERDPSLRRRLKATHPVVQLHYNLGGFDSSPIGKGLSPQAIRRQPIMVYTLQLHAFSREESLRRFLSAYPWQHKNTASEGTGIYGNTAKHFRFFYGDESLRFKTDPLYLTPANGFTRVRYGLYESLADARRDADAWKSRYGINPLVIRIPFTEALVGNVLWGELPGVFEH